MRPPTDARIELWAGRESGELVCGCGHRLSWTNREQIGQLQWHMFACPLPEETNARLVGGSKRYDAILRNISKTQRFVVTMIAFIV